MKPKGILHVGAHLGQELEFYNSLKVNKVIWFEAIPEICSQLKRKIKEYPNHIAINSLLYSVRGKSVRFYISSNEKVSSSLNRPHLVSAVWPSIKFDETMDLKTETLDYIIQKKAFDSNEYNCLVLDTQGSELEVLKGFKNGIKDIEIIVTEISTKQLYRNSVLFEEIKSWLENQNFMLVASQIHQEIGEGNALFLKSNVANLLLSNRQPLFELIGRRLVFGIFIRETLLKFFPRHLVSKISRKK